MSSWGVRVDSHGWLQAFFNLRGDPRLVLHVLWLVLHVRTQASADQVLTTPSRAQLSIHTTSAKREFPQKSVTESVTESVAKNVYQKCPSIIFILCRGIKIVYIFTYTCTQNLSPTFLWVSNFDVKLGSWDLIF